MTEPDSGTSNSVDSGSAGKNLSKLLVRVAAGESFEITKYGKVVALLIPAVEIEGMGRPEIPKPVTLTTKASGVEVMPDNSSQDPGVDDWGLPLEPFPANSADVKPVEKLSVPNPAPLKPYKTPTGLSKKQQAGQKYDR